MKHAFLDNLAYGQSRIHDMPAAWKVAGALLSILLLLPISRVAEMAPVWSVTYLLLAGALTVLAIRARLPFTLLLKKTLVVVPFVFLIVLLNAVVTGFQWAHLHLALRGVLSIWILVTLISTTRLSAILNVLARWRVPRVLLLTISFIYRYYFILKDEYESMVLALKARGVRQNWLHRLSMLATMTASLFIRSYERAERVHQAMVMRGFNGVGE